MPHWRCIFALRQEFRLQNCCRGLRLWFGAWWKGSWYNWHSIHVLRSAEKSNCVFTVMWGKLSRGRTIHATCITDLQIGSWCRSLFSFWRVWFRLVRSVPIVWHPKTWHSRISKSRQAYGQYCQHMTLGSTQSTPYLSTFRHLTSNSSTGQMLPSQWLLRWNLLYIEAFFDVDPSISSNRSKDAWIMVCWWRHDKGCA